MSADAIGPGDWVECVDDKPRHHPVCNVTRGCIYRVRSVFPNLGSGPGLALYGVQPAGGRSGFHADRFRPVRSDITSLEMLLTQPIPADLVDV